MSGSEAAFVCTCNSGTSGRLGCLVHNQNAGVYEAARLRSWTENSDLCARGYHAWVPWLQLPSGSFVTWCARESCDHAEQYDGPAVCHSDGGPE